MDNNKYILVDADSLISDLKAIVDYCDSHLYKSTVSRDMVRNLPYLDKPSITLHLYTRDASDGGLHALMKRACDACRSAVVHVLAEDADGKLKVTGGVTLRCRLLQHGSDESLMEPMPKEWLQPVGLVSRRRC